MIVEVTKDNIIDAAKIHSLSWKDSHRSFCSSGFIAIHSVEHQIDYLNDEIKQGKKVFMLVLDKPVGIVSIWNDLIENLYVLPEEQCKGYGTGLLLFAIKQCKEKPSLWILDNNHGAYKLYTKHGFKKTGKVNLISKENNIYEEEMVLNISNKVV